MQYCALLSFRMPFKSKKQKRGAAHLAVYRRLCKVPRFEHLTEHEFNSMFLHSSPFLIK